MSFIQHEIVGGGELRWERIAARDPDDWPTVALALALGVPVWSQDKDLTAAGVDVATTGELLDALRDAGHIRLPAWSSLTREHERRSLPAQ
ncbi:MAG: hypothetical protein LC790_14520 [Actinobacteria bacterium]|nr:hypothetical protein [Actinomycetota bacterium]